MAVPLVPWADITPTHSGVRIGGSFGHAGVEREDWKARRAASYSSAPAQGSSATASRPQERIRCATILHSIDPIHTSPPRGPFDSFVFVTMQGIRLEAERALATAAEQAGHPHGSAQSTGVQGVAGAVGDVAAPSGTTARTMVSSTTRRA
ncbi:hypothetical protein [Nocardia sp. NPDC003979]